MMVVKAGIGNPDHKKIFEQLVLIENFQVFKKLMVKRNKALELECIRELEGMKASQSNMQMTQEGLTPFGSDTAYEKKLLEKEKAELEAAIAASLLVQQQR